MLYYRSATDFSQKRMRISELATVFKLSTSTISNVIITFKRLGSNLDTFGERKRKESFTKISDHVGSELLKPSLLNDWAVRTMEERVVLIKARFGVAISRRTLASYYQHHGVRYRNTKMVYSQNLARKDELDAKRMEFCKKLGTIVCQRRDLIYMDESSTNGFM